MAAARELSKMQTSKRATLQDHRQLELVTSDAYVELYSTCLQMSKAMEMNRHRRTLNPFKPADNSRKSALGFVMSWAGVHSNSGAVFMIADLAISVMLLLAGVPNHSDSGQARTLPRSANPETPTWQDWPQSMLIVWPWLYCSARQMLVLVMPLENP
jgi:hypothetical protein